MIIAVDPGTSFCGMSVVSHKDGKEIVHTTRLVIGTRKPKEDLKDLAEKHGSRYSKIIRIIRTFKELVELYEGEIENIVVELPFYNSRTPGAFEPIVQVNTLISYIAQSQFGLVTYGFEPRTVKVDFAGTGGAKKEHMREAFYHRVNNGTIILPDETPKEEYVEHVIDSIGVAHTWYQRKEEIENELNKKNIRSK